MIAAATPTKSHRIQVVFTAKAIDNENEITIMVIAVNLARSGMLRCSSHSRRVGPNSLVASNQRWKVSEDRAKHAAARITSGVVGRTGRITPSSPSARHTAPAEKKSQRTIVECFRLDFTASFNCLRLT